MSMLDFRVRTSELSPESYVVSVDGELDLHTTSELEQALMAVLSRGGRNVIVDLARLVFIDSTALVTLLRAQPHFRSRGGRLLLVSEDRRILRTLEITGLTRAFDVEPQLGRAVELVLAGPREPVTTRGGEAA